MENTNTALGTIEYHITVYGPQQNYDHNNSNNDHMVASDLSSAGAPMSKGVC